MQEFIMLIKLKKKKSTYDCGMIYLYITGAFPCLGIPRMILSLENIMCNDCSHSNEVCC